MGSHFVWVVKVEVDTAVEDEWNAWYNEIHVPEVMACPAFISARRLVSVDSGRKQYIAIYELESEQAVRSAEFNSIRGWGRFAEYVTSESKLYKSILEV
ncbi:DUF4286 family protein [SAR92 clade bacterium H246]